MPNESNPISDREYWENKYLDDRSDDLPLAGFVNRTNQLILEKIVPLLSETNRVLEVGAGGSLWLPYLASQYPDKNFTGLDYSQSGCERLRESVGKRGLKIAVVNADMFNPPDNLLGEIGLVLSFGVVEHFLNLAAAMTALRRFISSEGVIFTIVPNMSGILGDLTKRLDPAVYGIHVPHDLKSFVAGHKEAGLDVCEAGYLCSSDFGVLSSAVPPSGAKFEIYKWLSRLSKLGWLFEEKFFPLPATPYFSPVIYCIAKLGTEDSDTCES